jgi:hypothetical protein
MPGSVRVSSAWEIPLAKRGRAVLPLNVSLMPGRAVLPLNELLMPGRLHGRGLGGILLTFHPFQQVIIRMLVAAR